MAADQILDEATEVHPIKTGPAIVVRASNVNLNISPKNRPWA